MKYLAILLIVFCVGCRLTEETGKYVKYEVRQEASKEFDVRFPPAFQEALDEEVPPTARIFLRFLVKDTGEILAVLLAGLGAWLSRQLHLEKKKNGGSK